MARMSKISPMDTQLLYKCAYNGCSWKPSHFSLEPSFAIRALIHLKCETCLSLSISHQNEVTGKGLRLPVLKRKKKLDKVYETLIFRH